MPKTITLRLSDRDYAFLRAAAEADNRPIANLIETAAMRQLREEMFVSPEEMKEIRGDKQLMADVRAGQRDVKRRRGRFVA